MIRLIATGLSIVGAPKQQDNKPLMVAVVDDHINTIGITPLIVILDLFKIMLQKFYNIKAEMRIN